MRISDWSSDVCSSDLCELNVLEQVVNVCHTTIVRDAWSRGQPLSIHGWVYTLRDGRVHDLRADVVSAGSLPGVYADALARIQVDRERSEERRVGKGCVGPCKSWWSPYV